MSVTMKDIVSFEVSDEVIKQAKAMRQNRDSIYGNIYKERETDIRYVGDIGEIILDRAFRMCSPDRTVWNNQLMAAGDYDFQFCGIDIEAKTVKRKVPLRPYYKAQITARHINSEAQWLVFTCYEYPRRLLHVKGVMHKDRFKQIAEYYKAGDQVHENYTIVEGHEIYAVTIRDMTPFRLFLSHAMKGTVNELIST